MKEFFIEEMNYYTPSDRDCTSKFFLKVLNGTKQLLSLKEVKFAYNVPQDSEIKTKKLYDKAILDPDIKKFLPDMPKKKIIGRSYLLNILNTIHPGVIKVLVQRLRAAKVKKREENMKKYVVMKKVFAEKLNKWKSKR